MEQREVNIFYTDDDKDDIAFFEDAVAEAGKGIHVTTRFDGGGLLHLLNNPPPDPAVVFLDWNMPGSNGAEVLREIRMNEKTRTIPVVIFSTSDSIQNIEEARRLGANMYITKPNSFKDIVKMIQYCAAIDWKTFKPDDGNFVYKIS